MFLVPDHRRCLQSGAAASRHAAVAAVHDMARDWTAVMAEDPSRTGHRPFQVNAARPGSGVAGGTAFSIVELGCRSWGGERRCAMAAASIRFGTPSLRRMCET